ncbi:hypothetical protein LP416_13155 [Polaromonas sp. P2-4]|nr:hypothetical protein LP416_13155 [Polaromonas sp. P2-4]
MLLPTAFLPAASCWRRAAALGAVATAGLLAGASPAFAATRVTGFTARTGDVNGTRIHYRVGGSGPAAVLLHGYAGNQPHVKPADAAAGQNPHGDRAGPARRRRFVQARGRL